VPSGKVSEMTGYEFEPDTECYIVEYEGKTYYVALMKNGTDADDNLDSFLTLHERK
jgi:YHS domain-containing protein